MSPRDKIGIIALMMAMGQMQQTIPTERRFNPKGEFVPKGAKQYFFNRSGDFSTVAMRHESIVFKCLARSDESALKKFYKWQKYNLH